MSAPKDTFWTDSIVARLRELAAQHLSASEIAEAIGGVSRNSVIGILRRKGIPLTGLGEKRSRAAKMGHQTRARPRPPFKPKFEPPVAVTEALPATSADDAAIPRDQLKTLVELEAGECRWPIDQPNGGFLFCSSPALDGRPYCAGHSRRAYNPGAYRSALRVTK